MMRFNRQAGLWVPLAGVLLLFTLFKFQPITRGQIRRAPARPVRTADNQSQSGLQFRLSEGAESKDQTPPVAVAPATPLNDAETAALLKRLPPLKAELDDAKDFALRDRSLPPPRTGQTIQESFPPAASQAGGATAPEARTNAPLEVVRFAPEGDVPIAPHLSVTFSQPMVAVTSQSDAAQTVPVKLTPQPAGQWRWLGTKTLLFEAKERFPMATTYTVEVAAGTKSTWGNALAATKRWTFNTPPLTVKNEYPTGGPQRRDPLLFIEFDQRINPSAVLGKLSLGTASLRLATAEEIAADETVSRLVKAAQPERWIAFKPVDLLPAATTLTVRLAAGAPSAEGPRVTATQHTYSFNTYDVLKLTRHQCGWQERCEPFTPWTLEFNNPLDVAAFDKKWFRVEPDVPGLQISNYGSVVNLQGATKGRTTYRVMIDAAVRDQFGQTLGQPVVVTFTTTDAQPNLTAAAENFAVLDPYAAARFSVFTVNHQQLKTTLYSVGPEHWAAYTTFLRESGGGYGRRGRDWKPLPPMGRLVYAKTIDVAAQPDQLTETALDLSPALTDGVGQMVLAVEAVQPPKNEWERRAVYVWLQATQIGLDAFVDHSEVVAWASSLKDGKPLGNATIELRESAAGTGETARTGTDGLARFVLPATGKRRLLVARAGKDVALLPQNFFGYDDEYNGWQKGSVRDALAWHVFDDRGLYKPGEEVRVKGWLRKISGGPRGDVGAAGITTVSYALNDSRGNEISKGVLNVNALGGFDTKLKLPPTMNLGNATVTFRVGNQPAETNTRVNTVRPGQRVMYGNDDNTHLHSINVQEFRRPEYEVSVKASAAPHFIKGQADVTVAANYYAGGGLPNAQVNWIVATTPTNYTPPNRGDYTFGAWTPWWEYRSQNEGGNSQSYQARTDAAGKHHLQIDFDSVAPPRPSSVTATAMVQDVNRQALSGSTTLLVHPAELYVGLRSPRTFVQPGEPLLVQAIVTDLDGKAVANREVKMRAVQLAWTFEKGEWKQTEQNAQECTIRSAADAVQCRFEPKEGGTYRVTALIYDDRERPNQSELTLWVAGGKRPPSRELAQEKVELIPNQKEYKPGDVAEILVQAPFANAEGVVTLRRAGLVRAERFTVTGASHTLRVPLTDEFTPNLHVQVDLAGAAERTGDDGQVKAGVPKRPAFASGTLNLPITTAARKLTVSAVPRDKALEPGGSTPVTVELRDAANKPVAGGEVALVVVDEAVLALTNYKLGDPLATFYPQRGDDVSVQRLREKVTLSKPDALISQLNQPNNGRPLASFNVADSPQERMRAAAKAMPMASPAPPSMAMVMADRKEAQAEPIQVRANFDALAFFAAALPTDANGRATVTVKLPDNLTRYRVMAVAVAGEKQFGTGEAAITARLPLMARPAAPRFLNFGDRVELPVVLQNQTDAALTVEVAVRAVNATFVVPPSGGRRGGVNDSSTTNPSNATPLPPTGGTTNMMGRRVTVPANDRVEVRFPATTVRPGTARFQFAASAGKWADAAEIALPVWTPATTEAFATYGELDAGAGLQAIGQPVKAPSDAITSFGGLEITTSSTQLQALTDAVIYLSNYPYECAEQIASRVLAIAALRDVLGAFDAKGLPDAATLEATVKRDLERLRGMQNGDGGFGFWRSGEESWPYLSIHVAHAVQRAKEKGYDVPAEMQQRSQQYLRNVPQNIPGWYSAESKRALTAYALYTRNRMGDRDVAGATALIANAGGVEKTPLEALGWLLPVMQGNSFAAVIQRQIANRAEETAATAHFTTSYSDGAQVLLHSDRRADAILLEALIGPPGKEDLSSDLIPKIARGLLAQRKAGRWENTQENCWVLLALDRYFQTYEKVTPDFIARAWLGDNFAGQHAFKGRTTERSQLNVPMNWLASNGGLQNLILSKEGAGRLYYRIGMNYAPRELQLQPADYGFTVTRTYEAVDDANDVRRQEDGTWRIKAGAQVRVRLTLVAPTRRYHVALVDPLPAGLEAANPALAVTGPLPHDPQQQAQNRWWWWQRQWFEHQNLRDERVEAFTSLLWEGVYNYSYVARATTPGVFVVPPPKAEEMYHPETFGRGASARVVVE